MKKIIILLAVFAIAFQAKAQKLDASKVPATVKAAFAKQYPKITSVKWEMEDGKYEASFKQDGKSMSTLQDSNGNITETEVDIKVADLPASVTSYVKQHYKGKAIKEGARITKANGEINYEAEVGGTDVIFDANGKFIKEEKE
jgi:Skp family chaperone for outer membrane proteins